METIKALPRPCESCPWRLDRDARDIPNFSLDLAEKLVHTCPDKNGMGPGHEATWFACHTSREESEFPCAGWLAVVGNRHPRVRLAIRRGNLNANTLEAGENWPELHADYFEVLEKLRDTADDDGR